MRGENAVKDSKVELVSCGDEKFSYERHSTVKEGVNNNKY